MTTITIGKLAYTILKNRRDKLMNTGLYQKENPPSFSTAIEDIERENRLLKEVIDKLGRRS